MNEKVGHIMISIDLPWPAKELSPNARVHWAVFAKKKKQYKTLAYLATRNVMQMTEIGEQNKNSCIRIDLELHPKTKRKRDHDNFVASLKAHFDGIADALGVNDCNFRIGEIKELNTTKTPFLTANLTILPKK